MTDFCRRCCRPPKPSSRPHTSEFERDAARFRLNSMLLSYPLSPATVYELSCLYRNFFLSLPVPLPPPALRHSPAQFLTVSDTEPVLDCLPNQPPAGLPLPDITLFPAESVKLGQSMLVGSLLFESSFERVELDFCFSCLAGRPDFLFPTPTVPPPPPVRSPR